MQTLLCPCYRPCSLGSHTRKGSELGRPSPSLGSAATATNAHQELLMEGKMHDNKKRITYINYHITTLPVGKHWGLFFSSPRSLCPCYWRSSFLAAWGLMPGSQTKAEQDYKLRLRRRKCSWWLSLIFCHVYIYRNNVGCQANVSMIEIMRSVCL